MAAKSSAARGRAATPPPRPAEKEKHVGAPPTSHTNLKALCVSDLLSLGRWHYAMFGCVCLLWLNVGVNNASVAWTLKEMSGSLELNHGQEGFVASGFATGYCIGPVVMGFLLDKLGRRTTLLICAILPSMCQAANSMFLEALAFFIPGHGKWTSACALAFLRAVQACCSGGTTMCSKVYLNELLPSEGRNVFMSIVHTQIQFGGMALTALAVLAPSTTWQSLHLCLAGPGLFVFLLMLQPALFPESPEYLAARGQGDRAASIVRNIARLSNTSVDEASLRILTSKALASSTAHGSAELLRPPLRQLVLVLVANQFFYRIGQQGNDAWGMKFLEDTGRADQKPLVSNFKFTCKIVGGFFAAYAPARLGSFPLLVASYMTCALGTVFYCSCAHGGLQLALSWGMAYFGEEVANVLGMTTVVQAFPSRLRGRGVSLVSVPNAVAGILAGAAGALCSYDQRAPFVVNAASIASSGLVILTFSGYLQERQHQQAGQSKQE